MHTPSSCSVILPRGETNRLNDSIGLIIASAVAGCFLLPTLVWLFVSIFKYYRKKQTDVEHTVQTEAATPVTAGK